jgi:hypothetical protein
MRLSLIRNRLILSLPRLNGRSRKRSARLVCRCLQPRASWPGKPLLITSWIRSWRIPCTRSAVSGRKSRLQKLKWRPSSTGATSLNSRSWSKTCQPFRSFGNTRHAWWRSSKTQETSRRELKTRSRSTSISLPATTKSSQTRPRNTQLKSFRTRLTDLWRRRPLRRKTWAFSKRKLRKILRT